MISALMCSGTILIRASFHSSKDIGLPPASRNSLMFVSQVSSAFGTSTSHLASMGLCTFPCSSSFRTSARDRMPFASLCHASKPWRSSTFSKIGLASPVIFKLRYPHNSIERNCNLTGVIHTFVALWRLCTVAGMSSRASENFKSTSISYALNTNYF